MRQRVSSFRDLPGGLGTILLGGLFTRVDPTLYDFEPLAFGQIPAETARLDAQNGWAPPGSQLTLQAPDGSTLAVNSARNLLALLPVYVTLSGGSSPTLVLASGERVDFDNASQLAGYLERTAKHTAAADPLLEVYYQQDLSWLNEVGQQLLQVANKYIAQAKAEAGDTDRSKLDMLAAKLALEIAAQSAGARHTISERVQLACHTPCVMVGASGKVNFHDHDPGALGIIEGIVTIVVDIVAVANPELIPLAVAVHTAEAGQAFANGNILGGVLNLASAVAFGLKFASIQSSVTAQQANTLNAASSYLRVAAAATGGAYDVAHNAADGNGFGILTGLVEAAAAVASGFAVGAESAGLASQVATGLSGLATISSVANSIKNGDISTALLTSLALWLTRISQSTRTQAEQNAYVIQTAFDNAVDADRLGNIEVAESCQEFIATNCKASILRVFPGEFLDMELESVAALAKSGDRAARSAMKLMSRPEYRK